MKMYRYTEQWENVWFSSLSDIRSHKTGVWTGVTYFIRANESDYICRFEQQPQETDVKSTNHAPNEC